MIIGGRDLHCILCRNGWPNYTITTACTGKLVWARGINKSKPLLIRRVLSAGLTNETCRLFYLSAVVVRNGGSIYHIRHVRTVMHLSEMCDLPMFAKPSPLLM